MNYLAKVHVGNMREYSVNPNTAAEHPLLTAWVALLGTHWLYDPSQRHQERASGSMMYVYGFLTAAQPRS